MAEMTFVNGLGCIAQEYGLKEAVFLHNLIFWVRVNRSNGVNFKDGRWWSYNTFEGLAQLMPWWTAKQIRAIVKNCEEKGALLIGDYNENRQLRTLWYSPSDKVLAVYGDDWSEDVSDETICPFGQTERAEPNAQTGKCLIGIKNNNKRNTPIAPTGGEREGKEKICEWTPDRFLAFWAYYRDTFCASDHSRAGERNAAAIAWDKLSPDDKMLQKLAAKLAAIMRTRQWKDGIGIKMASTFLNGIRLGKISLDELPEPSPQSRSGAPPDEPQREENQWLN